MKFPAHKIVIISMRQIGDVLLVTPLFNSLRQAYPNAQIDVIVFKNKGGMLEGNPDINHVLEIAEKPTFKQHQQFISSIFRRYDLAISTQTGDKPCLYAWLAAPTRINVVPTYRWQDVWKYWIAKRWTLFDDKNQHTVLQNLQLADLLEIKRSYTLVPPQTQDNILQSLVQFDLNHTRYAVLHLMPRWRYKYWTISGWQALIAQLGQRGLKVVITGSDNPEEINYIQQVLIDNPKHVTNLAGKLAFKHITLLLQHSTFYVGPDTAVTHLAATTGIPTIALFGPTNPVKWSPFPINYNMPTNPFQAVGSQRVNNVYLLQGVAECVPCHQEGCEQHRMSESRCLTELSTEKLLAAIDSFKLV
jgi:heptosyltransferase-3